MFDAGLYTEESAMRAVVLCITCLVSLPALPAQSPFDATPAETREKLEASVREKQQAQPVQSQPERDAQIREQQQRRLKANKDAQTKAREMQDDIAANKAKTVKDKAKPDEYIRK
jgi:hypothetical protein